MDDDDARLMERIRQGDGESFGLLYDRTWRWLLSSVIRPRVGPGAAEEVLSETFRTALGKAGSFEWRGVGVLHWLSAIARRKSLERVRREAREAGRTGPFEGLGEVAHLGAVEEEPDVRADAVLLVHHAEADAREALLQFGQHLGRRVAVGLGPGSVGVRAQGTRDEDSHG